MDTVVEKGRGKYRSGPNDALPDNKSSEEVNVEGDEQSSTDSKEVVVSDILQDVPLPETGPTVRRSKYPFADLPVKGSFFVKGAPLKSIATACSNQNKRYKDATPKRRFIARAFTYNNEEGVMVWRVE